jgi:hypothetical protein
MNANYDLYQTLMVWESHQGHRRQRAEQGFVCKHCHNYVSAHMLFSSVQNRNHCPYCLWSRHMDLNKAGDRLAACKSQMQPVGLAFKQSHKKYGQMSFGELMLIHLCIECGKLSVNRIAADDDAITVLEVYEESLSVAWQLDGVQPLSAAERTLVRSRLYGIG